MSPFNYTVAPHLQHFAVPFPTFRAANPQYTCYVGGGLIFSRTASATDQDQNHKERGGKGDPPLRILLLQRSYEDSYGGQWEGPGGSCDPEDETLLDGVAREILEESGLHVSRFVELAGKDEWVRQRPGQIIVAAKFTFIVEVHEAKAAVPGLGVQEEEKEDGLPAAKLDDGTVVPALERRWEDLVKLDPAEHRAFEWVTEEEVKEAENDSSGKFKSFANQGRTMLEGFRILREASGVGGDA